MRKLIPFLLLLAFAASPASAQGTSQERSDCMGDALRFLQLRHSLCRRNRILPERKFGATEPRLPP